MKFPRISKDVIANTDFFVKLLDEWRQKLDTIGSDNSRTVVIPVLNGVAQSVSSDSKVSEVRLVQIVGDDNTIVVASMGWINTTGGVSIRSVWQGSARALATFELRY